jgi:hypothetical protein
MCWTLAGCLVFKAAGPACRSVHLFAYRAGTPEPSSPQPIAAYLDATDNESTSAQNLRNGSKGLNLSWG